MCDQVERSKEKIFAQDKKIKALDEAFAELSRSFTLQLSEVAR